MSASYGGGSNVEASQGVSLAVETFPDPAPFIHLNSTPDSLAIRWVAPPADNYVTQHQFQIAQV